MEYFSEEIYLVLKQETPTSPWTTLLVNKDDFRNYPDHAVGTYNLKGTGHIKVQTELLHQSSKGE